MKRLLKLLEERNHYLEKFYTLNENQLVELETANYNNIEAFYQNREGILEVISYIDTEIEKFNSEEPFALSNFEKTQIRENLIIKKEFIKRILDQDFKILAKIENAKNEIIKELSEVKSGRKAISGYKSKTHNYRLNEEV
jgi:hypothetical protein